MAYMNEETGKMPLIQEIEKYIKELQYSFHTEAPLLQLDYAVLKNMRDTLKEKFDEEQFHN
jgi:hypothetical protein